MSTKISRIVGSLLILQMAGFIVPFILLHPMAPSKFLLEGAQAVGQVKLATYLLLFNGGLTVAISACLWRAFDRASATLLLLAGGLMFVVQGIDNAHLMSMLAMSASYQSEGKQEALLALAPIAAETRNWIHYIELLIIDLWIMGLYISFIRCRSVPQGIAAFGIVTVLLHFGAITLPLFLGITGFMPLGALMAISHLVLAGWVLTKGIRSFSESQ